MALDKITLADLFDFSNTSELDKGLDAIKKTQTAFRALTDTLVNEREAVDASIKALVKNLSQLEKKLKAVNIATAEGQEEARKYAASVEADIATIKNLTEAQGKLGNRLVETEKTHKTLEKSYNRINNSRKAFVAANNLEIGSLADLKLQLTEAKSAYEQMGVATDATVKQTQLDKIERIGNMIRDKKRALDDAAKGYNRMAAEAKKAAAEEKKRAEQELRDIKRINAERRKAVDTYVRNRNRSEVSRVETIARNASSAASRPEVGSLDAMKNEIKQLMAEFRKMGDATDQMVKDRALQKINELSGHLRDAEYAMQQARRGAMGVADSYAGLVRENAQLMRQLREMPDAFNRITGEINEQNQAARELVSRLNTNTQALRQFDAQIGRHQRNVGNYGSAASGMMSSMRGGVMELAAQLFGLITLADAVGAAMKHAFDSNLKLSDAQAAVRKTVGMTKDEVDELAESFKSIDTRSGLEGLMSIAKIGGQFGVAKNEIKDFTVATDKAAVALSDEFKGGVEEVATELYTLRGLFADTREMNPAEAMLKIGSAINSLGADGAATGPVIAEFAKRIGQLGDMGLPIEQALGMGAALQEMGLSAEIASGGYSNMIIQLRKHSKDAADVMQITVDQFRAMMDNDPNAVIMELSQRLSQMPNGLEVAANIGIQSQESIKVMNTLASNVERVNEQLANSKKAYEEGTSIAEEFAIANDTLAGSWEKLKNSMSNLVTSGAIGNWMKREIDGLRLMARDLQLLFGGVSVNNATQTSGLAARFKTESEEAMKLVETYKLLSNSEGMAAANREKLNEIGKRLSSTMGANAAYIDEETGAWKLNYEEIERVSKLRGEEAEDYARQTVQRIEDNKELVKTEKNKIEALEREIQVVEEHIKTNSVMVFGMKLWTKEAAQAEKGADKLEEMKTRLAEAANLVEEADKDSKKAMEELTKAGYSQVDMLRLLNEEWAKRANPVKQGEAVFGSSAVPTPGVSHKSDGIPDDGVEPSDKELKKQEKALDNATKALRRYRDELEKTQDEIKVIKAREVVETAEYELKVTQRNADPDDPNSMLLVLDKMEDVKNAKIRLAEEETAARKREARRAAEAEIAELERVAKEYKKEGNSEAYAKTQEAIKLKHQSTALQIADMDRDLTDTKKDLNDEYLDHVKETHDKIVENEKLLNGELAALANERFVQKLQRDLQIREQRSIFDTGIDKPSEEKDEFGMPKRDIWKSFGGDKDAQKEVAKRVEMSAGIKKQDENNASLDYANKVASGYDPIKAKAELDAALEDAEIRHQERLASIHDKAIQEKIARESEALEVMQEAYNTFFNIMADKREQQMERLKYNYDQEIEAAGDNKQLKIDIEEKYEKKELAMKQKNAKWEKAQALFNIAVDTAQGVMAYTAIPGMQPMIPFVIAMGALQMAAVAAKPIPQFYKGTKSSPEGLAEVAERGPEILEYRGQRELVTERQVRFLEKGTKVYTAQETTSILRHLNGDTVAGSYSSKSDSSVANSSSSNSSLNSSSNSLSSVTSNSSSNSVANSNSNSNSSSNRSNSVAHNSSNSSDVAHNSLSKSNSVHNNSSTSSSTAHRNLSSVNSVARTSSMVNNIVNSYDNSRHQLRTVETGESKAARQLSQQFGQLAAEIRHMANKPKMSITVDKNGVTDRIGQQRTRYMNQKYNRRK